MTERIGVLVGPRGRGSNLRAIAMACASGQLPAEVAVVVAPAADSLAVQSASSMGLPTTIVSPQEPDYGAALVAALAAREVTLVCLAGYLRLLPHETLEAYPRRVLNIHPALLPKFGGKGMYGAKVHVAVLAAGETVSGCTVHFVDDRYDEGDIVLQETCPVLPGDTPETLAARVLEREHIAYVEAIRRVVGG